MHKYLLILLLGLLIPNLSQAQPIHDEYTVLTTVKYNEDKFDFGERMTGEIVEKRFTFVNTGTEDLIIEWAMGSCGCTKVEFDSTPIPPGEEGYVDVFFDLVGRTGKQLKFAWIQTNTKPIQHTLTITGIAVE